MIETGDAAEQERTRTRVQVEECDLEQIQVEKNNADHRKSNQMQGSGGCGQLRLRDWLEVGC